MAARRPADLHEDVLFGLEHDAFDDDLGQSLLEIYRSDADVASIEPFLRSQVSPHRQRERFGETVPYRLPRSSRGKLILGMDERGREARTVLKNMCSGTLLTGSTGSGKTQFLIFLLLQLALIRSVRTWAEDAYKTGLRHILPYFERGGERTVVLPAHLWKWNLLQADLRDPRSHVARSADLIVRILGLQSRASSIIQQAIDTLFVEFGIYDGQKEHWPTLFHVYEKIKATSGLHYAAKESILGRLGSALRLLGPRVAAYLKGWTAADLKKHSIVFENRGASEHTRRLLMESLLFAVFEDEVMNSKPNADLSLLICLDDAQRILSDQDQGSGLSSLEELLGIIRGSGLGIIISLQSAYGISPKLTANLNTKIIGRLASHSDWQRLGPDMGLNPAQTAYSKHDLRPGRFVCQMGSGDWRYPYILNIPKFEIPPVVTDADVERSVERTLGKIPTVVADDFINWPEQRPTQVSSSKGNRDSPLPAEKVEVESPSSIEPKESRTLSKDASDYIVDIVQNPFDSVTTRDRRLSLGTTKGARIRKALLDRGLIERHRVKQGGRGRPIHIHSPTSSGRDYLKLIGIALPTGLGRGGPEHQLWVATIQKFATGMGLKSRIEDEVSGARIDLVIEITPDVLIAVEIEMRENALSNIQSDLAAGFSKIAVLLNEEKRILPLKKLVEEEFSKGGARIEIGELKDFERVIGRFLLDGSDG